MPVVAPSVPVPVLSDTAAPLLDLLVGQRQATFRFWLCDLDLLHLSELAVGSTTIPHIDNQSDRVVKRTLDGLEIMPDDAALIDVMSHRVEVEMLLSDGSVWPLGCFLFTANNQPIYNWGSPMLPSLADQITILAQPTDVPISVRPGSSVTDVMVEMLSNYRLPRGVLMEDSIVTTGAKAPMVWPPGTDRYEILSAIGAVAGFNPPYFNNAGVLVVESPRRTDALTEPSHRYEIDDSRILADTLVYSTDLLSQANRWLAIDSSATDNAVYGSYSLPNSDPGSAANRGFVQTQVISAQSLGSVEAAVALATKTGKAARTTETLSFSSPPDPRHDTFDTADVLGATYRETQWSLSLKEGEPMTHTMTRSYE